MSEQEKEKQTAAHEDHTNDDDRLRMISQSIKTMAAMAQVGVSYCIVIPGYGVREDNRLASNYFTRKDRSEISIVQEICGNLSTMLEMFMISMMQQDVPSGAIEGLIDEIVAKAKERFAKSTEGIGQGAGPQ